MNRRGFVASLVAVAVAPFLPTPAPDTVAWFGWIGIETVDAHETIVSIADDLSGGDDRLYGVVFPWDIDPFACERLDAQ